jgi:uncharacterized protein (DUF433 family)
MSVATLPVKENITLERGAVPAITTNQERMGGQSVIGTHRIQIGVLLDYIDLAALQEDFPSLTTEEIEQAIQYLKELGEDGRLGEPVNY